MRPGIIALLLVVTVAAAADTAPWHTAVEEFVQDLQSDLPRVRCRAAAALAAAADCRAVPALAQALSDPAAEVRREAARALGVLRAAAALPALQERLNDADPNVRLYAASALGEIRDPTAAPALVRTLARDVDSAVREQAAWALHEVRLPQTAGPLTEALRDEAADVRRIAWVLSHLDGEQPVQGLQALLRDPDAGVRRRALLALGEFGGDVAVAAGMAALADAQPEARLAAVAVLERAGTPRALQALRERQAGETERNVLQAIEAALPGAPVGGGLVVHWSFDDRNPTTARDLTGRGPAGEIKGCTVVEGKMGAALRCAGGSHVALGKPDDLPLAQTPFTVAAWVRPEAATGVVVARGGAFCGFSLYLKDGRPAFGIRRAKEEAAFVAAAGEALPTGAWSHLAGVVDATAILLFVNGRMAAETATPGLVLTAPGQGMEIGIDLGNSAVEITDGFTGSIDEVKVFDVALNAAQMLQQMGGP